MREGKAESHTVDVQCVKSDGGTSKEEEEDAPQPVVDPAVTVSSFLTLNICPDHLTQSCCYDVITDPL